MGNAQTVNLNLMDDGEFKEGQKVYVEAIIVEEYKNSPELEIRYRAGKQCDYVPNDIIHPIPEPIELPQWIVDIFNDYEDGWLSVAVNKVMNSGEGSELIPKFAENRRELEKVLSVAFATKNYTVEKEPKWYGWYENLFNGEKVFVSKTSYVEVFDSSHFDNSDSLEEKVKDLSRYQFTKEDRKTLPVGWQDFITWEEVKESR